MDALDAALGMLAVAVIALLGCRIAGAFSFREPSKSALLREDVRAAFGVVVAFPRCVGAEAHVEERSRPGLREAEALAVHGEFGGEAHWLSCAARSSSDISA